MIVDVRATSNGAMTDRSGITWVATSGYGALKVNSRLLDIKHFFRGSSVYGHPFATSDGEIIVRNPIPHGVLYHPGHRPKFKFVADKLADASEGVVLHSVTGDYWLLTQENWSSIHLYRLDTTRQSMTEMAAFDCLSPGLFAATADASGNIVIACENMFSVYDVANSELIKYDMGAYSRGESGYYIIEETAPGVYWIGSPNGLISANSESGRLTFEQFTATSGSRNGLQNDNVSALLADSRDTGVLWIGTKGGGLQRLDTRTMDFTTYNTRSGLPNDVIYGLVYDRQGQIWASSNKGLIRFNPGTGSISSFVEADGLQSDEFNTYAYTSTSDGTLFFGGVNGMNVFDPQDLRPNEVLARPLITGIEINNVLVRVQDSTGGP